jgi:hypothetical protein
MFDKRCSGCGDKVERKFRYCPWCGASLKGSNDDFGMLGVDDSGRVGENFKLPLGLNKIMSSLVKQLEKDIGKIDMNTQGMPKGFKIQIGGRMPMQMVQEKPRKRIENIVVNKEEVDRRRKLKRVNADAKVKRLGDIVIYEIAAPGVSDKRDVVMTELETGLEIRIYTDDVCYVKTIPLKVEVLRWKAEKGKVLVEFKG